MDAQTRRFDVLCKVVEPGTSVMDVGCGLGDLLGFLRRERGFMGQYLGLDFVPEFIEHARHRYLRVPRAQFQEFDARFEGFPHGYDAILISGAFNNLMTDASEHLEWIRDTLERTYCAARAVVAFNGLSTAVERLEPDLFYSNPGEMVSWCLQHLTRKIRLRHDYNAPPSLGVPVDYTIYLYR